MNVFTYAVISILSESAGKQESVDATLAALEVVGEPLKSMAYMLVDVCAYAGGCFTVTCVFIFTINWFRNSLVADKKSCFCFFFACRRSVVDPNE